MKKLLKIALLASAAGLVLTGCNKKGEQGEEATIAVDKATLSVKVGQTAKLVADAKNGEGSVTWSTSDPSVVSISEDGTVTALKEGTATITVTYNGKTATCVVTVLGPSADYRLAGVQENKNIRDFRTNVADEQNEFKGETKLLLEVGDDNEFVMKPTLRIIDKQTLNDVDESAWDYDYEYDIKEWNGEAYVAPAANYLEKFDARKVTFDFAENAIGKQLKLSVTPGGLTDAQKADAENTKTIEVKVSNGWNVYSANELAYFNDNNMQFDVRQDGCPLEQSEINAAWTAFRNAKGLDAQYVAPGIFLQHNVKLVKDNVPAEFFHTDPNNGTVGTLMDSMNVYARHSNGFVFNGNYFNIDTQDFPTGSTLWNEANDGLTHSTLFKVVEARDFTVNEPTAADKSEIVFKNCSYFGNGPRTNENTEAARAGLIFIKVNNFYNYNKITLKATFENFNVRRAVISFYCEYGMSEMNVKDCIIEEGYANGIYLYRRGNLNFQNSELRNFGGPIIVTQSDEGHSEAGFHVSVDNNTVLDNMVAGTEPWFMNTHANTAMDDIQKGDAIPNAFGKTFIQGTDKLMNFIIVNRGDLPYVVFDSGTATPAGIDGNSPEAGDMLTAMHDDGIMYFLTDDNAFIALDGMTPAITRPMSANAKYLNYMLYNPMFGYISMVYELFNLAS